MVGPGLGDSNILDDGEQPKIDRNSLDFVVDSGICGIAWSLAFRFGSIIPCLRIETLLAKTLAVTSEY